MSNASPYVPSIHLSNALYLGQTPNMNLGPEMQRRTAELAERRARRAIEDAESDDGYHQDRDVRGRRNYDYREEDRRDFRRDQDDLEIAHMERRVEEANHALEDAMRDLEETKMRIRNRRREERQPLNERSRMNNAMPEFVRPFVDDVYERVSALLTDNILILTHFLTGISKTYTRLPVSGWEWITSANTAAIFIRFAHSF